ncbi:MAG: hypothetical protein ACRDQA_11995, partial [Nocardioidaceae bacterium]
GPERVVARPLTQRMLQIFDLTVQFITRGQCLDLPGPGDDRDSGMVASVDDLRCENRRPINGVLDALFSLHRSRGCREVVAYRPVDGHQQNVRCTSG